MSERPQFKECGGAGLLRVLLYALALSLMAGLAACAWLVFEATRPERGANMILMALPALAAPMMLVAAIMLGLIFWRGGRLSKTERVAFLMLAATTVLPFLALAALG